MLFDIGFPVSLPSWVKILWKIWKFWKWISADQIHSGGEDQVLFKSGSVVFVLFYLCAYISIHIQVFVVIDNLDRDFDESRSKQLVSWRISAVGASCSWFIPMGGSNTESSSTRGSTGSHGDHSDWRELWRDKRLSASSSCRDAFVPCVSMRAFIVASWTDFSAVRVSCACASDLPALRRSILSAFLFLCLDLFLERGAMKGVWESERESEDKHFIS